MADGRIPGPACGDCGKPLPIEYSSGYCDRACATRARTTLLERATTAEAELAAARAELAEARKGEFVAKNERDVARDMCVSRDVELDGIRAALVAYCGSADPGLTGAPLTTEQLLELALPIVQQCEGCGLSFNLDAVTSTDDGWFCLPCLTPGPDEVQDMLALVSVYVRREHASTWTDEQRRLAGGWAAAAYAQAGDHDVEVPQRPDFLPPAANAIPEWWHADTAGEPVVDPILAAAPIASAEVIAADRARLESSAEARGPQPSTPQPVTGRCEWCGDTYMLKNLRSAADGRLVCRRCEPGGDR